MKPSDTQRFLDMQEHPEKYSDQELEALMDDLDRLPDVEGAWRRTRILNIRRIAAIFFVAAFLGGLAWAIGGPLLTSPKGEEPQPPQVTSNPLPLGGRREGASSPQRFSNIRLDSILTVVSEHYGKTVRYRNDEPRAMKLITTWNPADSLSAFIEHLNMFDYLHLTLQGDTIFVEYVEEEVAQ